jgi:phenylpropionate dioxygenase-like ring-hydroxylating dioxygenase large terminal subunit
MATTSTVASPALRRCWHPVLRAADLGDEPVARTLLGERLVLFRDHAGVPAALPDRCPHREEPLSLGQLEGGFLRCAYHGWVFAGDGHCVEVPSNGPGVPAPPRAHLAPLRCAERYGLVWVCPGEPAAGIPEVEQERDAAFRRINVEVQTWRTSALRMVDNFLDVAHFPWVHAGTLGSSSSREVAPVVLEDLGDFHGYAYEVEVANASPEGTRASGSTAATLTRRMTSGFALPFTCRSTIRYESGLEHVLLLCSTPVDDETAYFTFVVWRNDDRAVPAEEVIAFDRAIGEEDRRMLEAIGGPFPLERGALCDVRADRTALEWRRRLVALLDAG